MFLTQKSDVMERNAARAHRLHAIKDALEGTAPRIESRVVSSTTRSASGSDGTFIPGAHSAFGLAASPSRTGALQASRMELGLGHVLQTIP
jgi:hypothetical protein